MILVSSFAMAVAVAQSPAVVVTPPSPPRIVTVPVPPRPTPPPNMTMGTPSPPPPPRMVTSPLPPRVAPPPLPEPGPAARGLAMRMLERITLFEREAQRSITNQLQSSRRGPGCDSANEECRRVAEEIAEREAASEARAMRDLMSRVLGAQFERTMNPAQIAEAERFLMSDAGQALIGSLLSINEQTLAALGPPSSFFERRREDIAEEFERRTRHLPRQTFPTPPRVPPPYAPPVPPPPPPPPPPPRP
jgi:hypothetical protein